MTVDKLDGILDMLEDLSSGQKKIVAMLSKESQETVVKELNNTVRETVQVSTGQLSWEIEYEGRTYKKFKPCKFKCGGLTSWPVDYKKGDQMLHIHPTDKEILGFSEKGLDEQWHCPVVRKK